MTLQSALTTGKETELKVLLKKSSFINILKKVINKKEDNISRRSLYMPMQAKIRLEALQNKYHVTKQNIDIAITEYGLYLINDMIDNRWSDLKNHRDLINAKGTHLMMLSINKEIARLGFSSDIKEVNISILKWVYVYMKDIAEKLNITTSSLLRVIITNAIKTLEENGEFEGFRKGDFDMEVNYAITYYNDYIKQILDYIKFIENDKNEKGTNA